MRWRDHFYGEIVLHLRLYLLSVIVVCVYTLAKRWGLL